MRILSATLGLLLLLPMSLAAQDAYEIVLRVNERISTTWDYQSRRADKVRMIQGAESLAPQQQQRMMANVGVSTMDDIFEELLMLSRADQLGIRVNEADLERALSTTMQNYGMESKEQFEEALRASGMSLDAYRENLSKSLLVQKLMGEEVHPRVTLEEEDLRRFYQNHLDDYQEPERLQLQEVVVLSGSGLGEDELVRTAQDIREQVAAVGDLGPVVASFVERGVTSNAVDLGWVEIGDLDVGLEKAVWKLETGGVSEPVKGRGGLHILVVTERQEARLRTFGEVEDQIRATEGERLLSSEMQQYLEELEAAAYVVVNPPPDAVGFRASLQMAADTDHLEQALTAPLITEPLVDEAANPSVEEGSATPDTESDEPPLR
jgi:parvulin-like peptidyl-prolyl isomerase